MQHFKFPRNPNFKVIYLILVAVTFVLYGNTLTNGYNLDDELVTKNHRLTSKGISAIPDIFTSPYYADEMGYAYDYRPMVLTTFAIEHSLFGESPTVSHFINVLLYSLTAILLFIILKSLFSGVTYLFPLIITLLFIAHPLHTEVVASIKNRDEILSLLGGLGAWYFAIKFATDKKWYFIIPSVVLFLFGMLSKLSVIPFAFLIPLSLVLITESKAIRILSLSAVYGLTVVLIIPLYNTNLQILFFLINLISPQLFYIIKYARPIKFYDVKFDYKKITVDSLNKLDRLNKTQLIFINVFIFSIYAIGILINFLPLIYFSFFLTLLFIFFSGSNSSKYFIILLSITSIFIIYTYGSFAILISLSLYFLLSAIHYDIKNKNIYLIAFVLLIPMFFIIEVIFFVVLLGLLYGIQYFKEKIKYHQYLVYGLLSIVVISLVQSSIADGFEFTRLLINLFFIVILAGLVFDQIKHTAPKIVIAILLIVNIFNYPTEEAYKFAEIDIEIETKTSPFITLTEDRQIEFVENPVTVQSPLNTRVATSLDILYRYLKIIVVPYPLSFYYGYAVIQPMQLTDISVILSVLIHFILLLLAVLLIRKHPIISFAITFYLSSILVYANFFYPVPGAMGERMIYIASLGFCIALVYILFKIFKTEFSEKIRPDLPKPLVYLLTAILLVYSFKTVSRNAFWDNPVKLFSNDIKHVSNSVQANNLLALHLMQESFNVQNLNERSQMQNQAVQHFKKALEIYPDFFNVYYDLGRTYMILQQWNNALEMFKYNMEKDLTFSNAYLESGKIYEFLGETEKAIEMFEHVIEYSPKIIIAYSNLGGIYFEKEDYEKSVEVSRKATQNIPNAYEGHLNLGKSLYMLGRHQEAIPPLHEAHRLNPTDPDVLMGLGSSYQMIGEWERGQQYINQAQRFIPR